MKRQLVLALLVLSLAGQAEAFSIKGGLKKAGHAMKTGATYAIVAVIIGVYVYGQSK